jgi:hypothetical protein
MNIQEENHLKQIFANRGDKILYWSPDSETCRIVKSIGQHAESRSWLGSDGEPFDFECAIFKGFGSSDNEYVELFNVELDDFILGERIKL